MEAIKKYIKSVSSGLYYWLNPKHATKQRILKEEVMALSAEVTKGLAYNQCSSNCLAGIERDMTTDRCIKCQAPWIINYEGVYDWITPEMVERAWELCPWVCKIVTKKEIPVFRAEIERRFPRNKE